MDGAIRKWAERFFPWGKGIEEQIRLLHSGARAARRTCGVIEWWIRFGRRVSSRLPSTFKRNAFAHQIPRLRPQYPPPPPNSSTNTTIIRINSMGSLL